MQKDIIVEKKLGIPADYQYKALNNGFWLQKNWHRNKFDAINMGIVKSGSKKVLDLGTGSGNFELAFAKDFKIIFGVDYNDEAISFLADKLRSNKIRNVKLLRADIRDLPKDVTDNKFDLIIIVDTIEHIKKKDALEVIIRSKKLLNPGAELVIITPNYGSIWVILEGVLDKLTIVPKFAGKQHLSKFDRESLSVAFTKAGFSQIKISSFNLFSFLSPFNQLNHWLLMFELKFLDSFGCLIYISGKNS